MQELAILFAPALKLPEPEGGFGNYWEFSPSSLSSKEVLVRKLPSYGRLSWAAFSPTCPPHHHVNHIIIIVIVVIIIIIFFIIIVIIIIKVSHQVVWKCNRTGTREFRFDKTLGRETPCFLSGKVASVVAEVGALFPRFRASICKSCTQNAHRIVARAQFHIQLRWPTELQNERSRLN